MVVVAVVVEVVVLGAVGGRVGVINDVVCVWCTFKRYGCVGVKIGVRVGVDRSVRRVVVDVEMLNCQPPIFYFLSY